MEVDKQAKAILNGEVIDCKFISPITIIHMETQIPSYEVNYKNKSMTCLQANSKVTTRVEIAISDPSDIQPGKQYYLVEVE